MVTNPITTKTIFSNGTFQLDVAIDETYTEAGAHISVQDIRLYEYAPDYDNATDPYELVESDPEYYDHGNVYNDDGIITGMFVRYHFAPKKDRLVKWVLVIPPYLYDESNNVIGNINICCADVDSDGNFVVEGYAADLTQYERDLLESVKLKCNDCEIPRDLLNKLLKLFTLRAAVESKSPYLEMIFSKLSCGKRYYHVLNSPSRNCNCNG